jgi:hypothetical protein
MKDDKDFFLIEDYPHLKKDKYSKGIVNTDNDSLVAYKKRRERERSLNDIESRVDNIEKKLDIIINSLIGDVND